MLSRTSTILCASFVIVVLVGLLTFLLPTVISSFEEKLFCPTRQFKEITRNLIMNILCLLFDVLRSALTIRIDDTNE